MGAGDAPLRRLRATPPLKGRLLGEGDGARVWYTGTVARDEFKRKAGAFMRTMEIALPLDPDVYAIYLTDRQTLCLNSCASEGAKIILLWPRARRCDD